MFPNKPCKITLTAKWLERFFLALMFAVALFGSTPSYGEHGDLSSTMEPTGGPSLPGTLADTSQGAAGTSGGYGGAMDSGAAAAAPVLHAPGTITAEEALEKSVPTRADVEAENQSASNEEKLLPRNSASWRRYLQGKQNDVRALNSYLKSVP